MYGRIAPCHNLSFFSKWMCSKTCVKQLLSKRQIFFFQDQILLNAGQKYCRMLRAEHPAIHSTLIKLPFVIKTFVLSIYEWPFTHVLLYKEIRNVWAGKTDQKA